MFLIVTSDWNGDTVQVFKNKPSLRRLASIRRTKILNNNGSRPKPTKKVPKEMPLVINKWSARSKSKTDHDFTIRLRQVKPRLAFWI